MSEGHWHCTHADAHPNHYENAELQLALKHADAHPNHVSAFGSRWALTCGNGHEQLLAERLATGEDALCRHFTDGIMHRVGG